jgi:hypothetical protein
MASSTEVVVAGPQRKHANTKGRLKNHFDKNQKTSVVTTTHRKDEIMAWNVPNGKEVNEGVEDHGGSVSMTGAGIDFMRLLQLRFALRLAQKGIRVSSNVPAASTIARRELGIKGNLVSLTEQVDAMIAKIQAERAES